MVRTLGRYLHQSYSVVVMAFGIVVGMILALAFKICYFSSPIWVAFSVLLLLLVYLRPRLMFISIALIAGMVLAFFRSSMELNERNYIRQFYGQSIVVTGIVEADPESDEKTIKVKLGNLKFGEDNLRETGGAIFVTISLDEQLSRSDAIVLQGRIEEGFGTYLGYMYKPKVIKVLKKVPSDLVLVGRNWLAERVKDLVPEPESSLGLSYLLGMKAGLSDEFSEKLRMVGLVHIVVASGAHLSILVEVARKIFGRLSRFAGLLFSLLFVVFFMGLVGWTPSIMRAGIMAILSLLAWYVGRKIEPWRIILLVMAFTLMLQPMFLIDLGWLLSFASFGGIMILGPKITKYFYGSKKPGFIAGIIITTISATLMTLPITLYYFGQVSLISIVANLLVLPTLSFAMGLTFLTGLVAGIPGVEMVISFISAKLLDFHIGVVNFFAEMEMFLVEIEPYNGWVFLIYGMIIVIFLVGWVLRRKNMVELKHE